MYVSYAYTIWWPSSWYFSRAVRYDTCTHLISCSSTKTIILLPKPMKSKPFHNSPQATSTISKINPISIIPKILFLQMKLMNCALNNTIIKTVYVSNTFWQLVCLVWSTVKSSFFFVLFLLSQNSSNCPFRNFRSFSTLFCTFKSAFCKVWALALLPPPLLSSWNCIRSELPPVFAFYSSKSLILKKLLACVKWHNSLHSLDTGLLVNAADSTPLHSWLFTLKVQANQHPPLTTSSYIVSPSTSSAYFSTSQK